MSKEEISIGVYSPMRLSFESATLVELNTDRKGYTYWDSYRPVSDARYRAGAHENSVSSTLHQLASGRYDVCEDDAYVFTTEPDLDLEKSTILVFHPKDVPEGGINREMLAPLVDDILDRQGVGAIIQATIDKGCSNG